MSVINTNITAMIGQQNLNESKSALSTSMERLSSGLRINSAKDDAAGQAIANRMSAQITGLSQAQRNANDGISLAQTAEGGLNQINDNLQRVRELTVQAQNDTNSASDIDSIQQEVNQRLEEIDRIARETDFNGSKILSKDVADTYGVQVGSQDGQKIDISISANTGWNKLAASGEEGFVSKDDMAEVNGEKRTVDAKGFDVLSAAAGTTDTTVNLSSGTNNITNGDTTSYVTDSSNDDQLYIKNETNVAATVKGDTSKITDGGSALTNASIVTDDSGQAYAILDTTESDNDADNFIRIEESMLDSNGNVTLDSAEVLAADKLSYNDVASDFTTGTDAASLATAHEIGSGSSAPALAATTEYYAVTDEMVDDSGNLTADLSTLESVELDEDNLTAQTADATYAVGNTDTPLKALDDALQSVDVQRSELGAIQNRFESAITNLSTNETNLSAARSRIEDADYATEVANMTRNQILQQAGTSVLAQANQLPQSALSLLG